MAARLRPRMAARLRPRMAARSAPGWPPVSAPGSWCVHCSGGAPTLRRAPATWNTGRANRRFQAGPSRQTARDPPFQAPAKTATVNGGVPRARRWIIGTCTDRCSQCRTLADHERRPRRVHSAPSHLRPAAARRARPGPARARRPVVGHSPLLRHPGHDGRRDQPRGGGARLRHAARDRRGGRREPARGAHALHVQLRHDRAPARPVRPPRGPIRRALRPGDRDPDHRRRLGSRRPRAPGDV